MADQQQGGDAEQERLWRAISAGGAGMLDLSKSGLHAQPMLALPEPRRKRLWFVTRRDTDLVASIGDGACGAFIFQDGELMASIAGALSVVEDRRRMARAWNAELAAWLPEGLQDPRLVMLRLDCVDAEVWVAGLGLTKFAWEIAWTGPRPQMLDLSGQGHATLH